jgi:hypothetical protein
MRAWIENLRKWIDGEESLDEKGEPQPRSKWDDFLVAVAREIEASMKREMFTPPGGPTYVPREYVVFLSPADDAEWQGEKREGLERGLHHVLSERAKELAGDNHFQTRTLIVDLRVDPGLEPTPISGPTCLGHRSAEDYGKTAQTGRAGAPRVNYNSREARRRSYNRAPKEVGRTRCSHFLCSG